MKMATTIGDLYRYFENPADAVAFYEGTGFRYLDYSFYSVLTPGNPFMEDGWKKIILSAKDAADRLGFQFVQAHSPSYNPFDPNTDPKRGMLSMFRAIEACGMLGVKNTVAHSGISADYRYPQDRDAYFEANLPFYRAMIPYMEEYGVHVLIENSCCNNMGGRYFPMTGEEMNAFITALGHPGFGACWDIGHAHIQKVDMRDEMVTLGKNLQALHIHDNDGIRDLHMPLFDGNLDFNRFMQGVVDSGFDGYFTFEVESHKPPFLSVKKQGLSLLYQTGKALLESIGQFEE